MRIIILAVLLCAGLAVAQPYTPYTIDTNVGIKGVGKSNLYNAVWRLVGPIRDVLGLNEAETECAKATAAEEFIRVTQETLKGSILGGLDGADEATKFFKKSQDDWCNKAGGKRGAEAVRPHFGKVRSVLRPFIAEQLDAIKARWESMTPAEKAAAGVGLFAAALASPALAF